MIQFTTIDRIFAKISRDLRGAILNESDVIEWVGEALDFLKMPQIQQEAVAFTEVSEYHTELPKGFHSILQIARNNKWSRNDKTTVCPSKIVTTSENTTNNTPTVVASTNKNPVPLDCDGKPIEDYEVAYYRPFFDLQWEYSLWTNSNAYQENYTPVRLANHTFFNSLVCKEKDDKLYHNQEDEYSLVGAINKKIRFSFREGSVAISYLKNSIDPETGYPLIPDDSSSIAAITYYVKWKIAQWYTWEGRDGFARIAQDSERLWLKYVRQAKNYFKMPKTLDQYQNLLEQTHYLIPRHRMYYGYFGKLGREENRSFNKRNLYY